MRRSVSLNLIASALQAGRRSWRGPTHHNSPCAVVGRSWGTSTLLRYFCVVLFAGALTVVATPSLGEENTLERESIETTYAELDQIIADLEGAITTAENALDSVKSMALEDGRTMTDTLFSELKGKVSGMLDGLAPNSVLMDNLEGAKANVIVLKRWFERQPPSYPNRDQLVMRVDETITGYGELTDLILTGRQDAQNALRELLRAQFYQSMELKVESAELSVEVTKRLVTSLRDLSVKIRLVAEEEVPSPIPS